MCMPGIIKTKCHLNVRISYKCDKNLKKKKVYRGTVQLKGAKKILKMLPAYTSLSYLRN